MVLRLLERLGHCADAVGNGAEAITALGKAQYDLVLMDVMMPEMDGLTATRRIREAERPTAHMTIIGLTAGSHPDNLADCLAAGMDAAATKPITLVSLGAAIAEGLERVATPPAAAPTENPVDALSDLREAFGDEALADIWRHLQRTPALISRRCRRRRPVATRRRSTGWCTACPGPQAAWAPPPWQRALAGWSAISVR